MTHSVLQHGDTRYFMIEAGTFPKEISAFFRSSYTQLALWCCALKLAARSVSLKLQLPSCDEESTNKPLVSEPLRRECQCSIRARSCASSAELPNRAMFRNMRIAENFEVLAERFARIICTSRIPVLPWLLAFFGLKTIRC